MNGLAVRGRSHLRVYPIGAGGQLHVVATCPLKGCRSELQVAKAEFDAWHLRQELIQNALPNLTDHQRELLLTGYCEPCWAEIFPEDEEDPWAT